jgi:hypothetical protein
MSDSYKSAGVCCGPHKEYGAMCVLTLAGNFTEAATQSDQKPNAATTQSTSTQTQSNKNAQPANSNSSNANKTQTGKPRKL